MQLVVRPKATLIPPRLPPGPAPNATAQAPLFADMTDVKLVALVVGVPPYPKTERNRDKRCMDTGQCSKAVKEKNRWQRRNSWVPWSA